MTAAIPTGQVQAGAKIPAKALVFGESEAWVYAQTGAQTFLRIVVPLMLGGILSGVVLTWVTVASELSATVVLYSGQWRTMTVVMFQALEGGSAGVATAAATLLIVVTVMHLVYAMGVSFTVVHPAFVDSESKGMETQRLTTDSRAAER